MVDEIIVASYSSLFLCFPVSIMYTHEANVVDVCTISSLYP